MVSLFLLYRCLCLPGPRFTQEAVGMILRAGLGMLGLASARDYNSRRSGTRLFISALKNPSISWLFKRCGKRIHLDGLMSDS